MKRFFSLIIIAFILISFTTVGYTDVVKNETVYVNLNYDGGTEKIKVVNHISGSSNEEYFLDYGKYDELEVLVNGVEPIIEDNKVKWPTAFLKDKDIYYEGAVDKPLPIKIYIKYFLDGKEINGEDLAGKSGRIKILISIKDSPDLTTQIQIPLNLNLFSNIEAPLGVSSIIGKTMTVVFNHLPIGDQEFVLEADGKNMELDSILISSTNSKINLPANIHDGINQLTTGIDHMSDAVGKLYDGSLEINTGTNFLLDGLRSLNTGIAKLFTGSKEIDKNSKIIKKGFFDFNSGLLELKDSMIGLIHIVNNFNDGLNTLNQQGKEIKLGLSGLSNGTTELKQGLDGLSTGLVQLNTNHNQLVELATSLANSSDPRVRSLAEGVIKEGIAIEALHQGAKGSVSGINALTESTNQIYLGYDQYAAGLDTAVKGFNLMNEQIKPLPEEMEKMITGHTELTNGLTPLFDGFSEINQGLLELSQNTKSLPNEVEKLLNGQEEISDGLYKLNKEGFEKIKSSIDSFSALDSSEDKETYTSFVDNKNNKNSTTQFIMKTPSIKTTKIANNITEEDNVIVKKGFLQRFLDLFRK